MDNEATYNELLRILKSLGMTPAPAKLYAARVFQEEKLTCGLTVLSQS
jgi:hypothetical protein